MSSLPFENSNSPGAKRPHRACLNCRRKKVRCHGEQPACSFCVRLGQSCRYPNSSIPPRSNNSTGNATTDEDYQALLSRIASIEAELRAVKLEKSVQSSILTHNPGEDLPMGIDGWAADLAPATPWATAGWHPFSANFDSDNRPYDPVLPTLNVQLSAIDDYFLHSHNQPYCFFQEENFRSQFSSGLLPDFLILTVLSIALRYSKDNLDPTGALSESFSAKAWSIVLTESFNGDRAPNYRLVQAATLLAIYDFTACRHGTAWIKIGVAVSLAQALQMTEEPDVNLPCASREEHRRTLWSIYILDKMATCGRRRPALFLDQHCNLHLPSSDYAFSMSISEERPTLNEFKSSEDFASYMLDSPAVGVVVASVLSQITEYALQKSHQAGRRPPWDHKSEYPAICTQLTRLEAVFDDFQPIQRRLQSLNSAAEEGSSMLSEISIFSYVIYQLCYCLLHHPILLHCRFGSANPRMPLSFLSRALECCRVHAQELTDTLMHAKQAGYILGASFYGYCLLVSGTVHAIFQYSENASLARQANQALQFNLTLLKDKAKVFNNSARMGSVLMQFSSESKTYCSLIDASCTPIYFNPIETERLYSLLDYGAMSTAQAPNMTETQIEESVHLSQDILKSYNFSDTLIEEDTNFFTDMAQMTNIQSQNFNNL